MVFHTSYIITGLLLASLIYLISKRNNENKSHLDYLILSVFTLFKESGFKSAPPFYKAFKKFVGKTPKEYHNSINITDSVESSMDLVV